MFKIFKKKTKVISLNCVDEFNDMIQKQTELILTSGDFPFIAPIEQKAFFLKKDKEDECRSKIAGIGLPVLSVLIASLCK